MAEPSQFSFRPIAPSDVDAVARSDHEAYGDEALPRERIAQWREKYPEGALIAWDQDGTIAASIGLWPLTQSSYNGLRDGTIHEAEIGPEVFPDVSSEAKCAHWTLAAIYVRPDHRGTKLLPSLLSQRFQDLAASGHAAENFSVLGLAFSEGGRRVMERLGFSPVGPDRDYLPAMEVSLDRGSLAQMPSKIEQAFSHRRMRPAPGAILEAGEVSDELAIANKAAAISSADCPTFTG